MEEVCLSSFLGVYLDDIGMGVSKVGMEKCKIRHGGEQSRNGDV